MKEAYYYLNLNTQAQGDLGKDNRESKAQDLLVNCAGSINTSINHRSENKMGRLDYYLMYVVSGGHYVQGNKERVQVNEGEAIIIPPHTPYTQLFTTGENLNYLWIHFTGRDVANLLSYLELKLFPTVNKTNPSNHLSTRFQRLFDCFSKNDRFREMDLSASLKKLLIELARATLNKEKHKISISKSVNYINSYYNTQLKITDLAKMDGLSMTRYNLHFKEQMGMPPTKYIIHLRMKMAKELLCTSDLTLNQIGSMCGYDDYNFFAKTFKSVYQASPKKYREENK